MIDEDVTESDPSMDNGWDSSAQAWIDSMGEQGERGDWGRQNVLDPVMMAQVGSGRFGNALDVGCGEGCFCRKLKAAGVETKLVVKKGAAELPIKSIFSNSYSSSPSFQHVTVPLELVRGCFTES